MCLQKQLCQPFPQTHDENLKNDQQRDGNGMRSETLSDIA